MSSSKAKIDPDMRARVLASLSDRSIVLVGLMGCGKSTVGRRVAAALDLDFVDADTEIEEAARKSIPEIFADEGEPFFRDRERRVIARLLTEKGHVLATGGGAYMDDATRENIRSAGICVWLKADLPTLVRRVKKRNHRPLLQQGDVRATMKKLMDTRYPVYAEADVTIDARDISHDLVAREIVEGVDRFLRAEAATAASGRRTAS